MSEIKRLIYSEIEAKCVLDNMRSPIIIIGKNPGKPNYDVILLYNSENNTREIGIGTRMGSSV